MLKLFGDSLLDEIIFVESHFSTLTSKVQAIENKNPISPHLTTKLHVITLNREKNSSSFKKKKKHLNFVSMFKYAIFPNDL
jgi:hypothetical protein